MTTEINPDPSSVLHPGEHIHEAMLSQGLSIGDIIDPADKLYDVLYRVVAGRNANRDYITPELAERLIQLGKLPEFWLNLQANYDAAQSEILTARLAANSKPESPPTAPFVLLFDLCGTLPHRVVLADLAGEPHAYIERHDGNDALGCARWSSADLEAVTKHGEIFASAHDWIESIMISVASLHDRDQRFEQTFPVAKGRDDACLEAKELIARITTADRLLGAALRAEVKRLGPDITEFPDIVKQLAAAIGALQPVPNHEPTSVNITDEP